MKTKTKAEQSAQVKHGGSMRVRSNVKAGFYVKGDEGDATFVRRR